MGIFATPHRPSGGVSRAPLHVTEVTSRRDRALFAALPARVYRDDPNWVAPLALMERQNFSSNHPFFRHAHWKRWLCWRQDEVVGRISAQIDHLSVRHRRDGAGYFGLLEAVDDSAVFAALLITAEQWLRDQGLTQVRGPFNLGINQEIGNLVEGFDTPPNFLMGHARRYYDAHILNAGFRKAVDVLAFEVDPGFEPSKIYAGLLRRLSKSMRVRPMDMKNKLRDLDAMRDIFNDAWANNWGFVPFTEEEFRAVGNELSLLIPPNMIQIAEVDGEPASFIVMLPNLNEAIADLGGRLLPFGWAKLLWRLKVRYPHTARVPLMGVRRKYQQTPLGPALAFGVMEAVRHIGAAKGVDRVEMSWILEDNEGMRHIIENIGGVMNKRYRLYERPLVGAGSSLSPGLVE